MKTKIFCAAMSALLLFSSCNKSGSDGREKTADIFNFASGIDTMKLLSYNPQSGLNRNVAEINNVLYDIKSFDEHGFDSVSLTLLSPVVQLSESDRSAITKIILFGDADPAETHAFNSFSLVSHTNEGVFFRHFINESGEFKLLRDSVIRFSSYCDRDLIALLQSDVNYSRYAHPTIEVLQKQSMVTSGFNYEKKLSPSLISMNLKYDAFIEPEEGGYCKKCGGGKSGSCQTNEVTNEKYCSDGSCRVSVINSFGMVANADSIYSFRNNIMKKYKFGTKYIAYYEYISFIINNFERPETISRNDEVSFLLSTLEAAYLFQYGRADAVVISQDYIDKAQSYMDRYKAYIPNETFHVILEDITTDLDYYRDFTRERILQHIE